MRVGAGQGLATRRSNRGKGFSDIARIQSVTQLATNGTIDRADVLRGLQITISLCLLSVSPTHLADTALYDELGALVAREEGHVHRAAVERLAWLGVGLGLGLG